MILSKVSRATLTSTALVTAETVALYARSPISIANSPAISTGCRPGRAGVPGNSFCLPSDNGPIEYNTGDAANLQRLSDADGRPILLVDTLADRVHRANGSTVVVGSGSPGSALLQLPLEGRMGQPLRSALL